jgi:hypothetical protein
MAYTLNNQKWLNANKKCMEFIKNTIENAIAGSIKECTLVGVPGKDKEPVHWLFKGVCYPAAQTAGHIKEVHMASGNTS